MDSATISALAALSGAVIVGVTSFGTSWLSQQTQAKVQIPASKHSFSGSRSSRYTKKKATADYADMTHYKARNWHAFLIAPTATKVSRKKISRFMKCRSSNA